MKKMIPLSLLTMSLTACFPLYKPADMTKTVAIKSQLYALTLCQNQKWYDLKKEANGDFRVSYGERISLIYHYFRDVGNGTVSCSPRLSFIPKAGNQYYLNFDIKGQICKLEMLRYSKKSAIGMVPESTVSRETSC